MRHMLLPVAVAIAMALPCAPTRAAPATPPITWAACPASLTGGHWPGLGARLHCGRVPMPLDHLHPDGRTIDVRIVRIAAARPGERKGAIFVNVGGPGGQPAAYVTSMADAFSEVDAGDPLHGDKRRLADRYDFVAVIPRGLKGGWEYECRVPAPTAAFLPTHRDDANWSRALADATALANACWQPVEAPYLSTEQHVRDMDAVRASLGDPLLHFYGISYGGRVGATYAAFFPTRIGRMLLDSTLMFTGSYRTGMYLTSDAEQAAFERDVLAPVQREASRYGQPDGADAIAWAVRSLSDELRPAWHDQMVTPSNLAAVLAMDRWVKAGGWNGWPALSRLAATRRFSPDPRTDTAMRQAATDLVERGSGAPVKAADRGSALRKLSPLIDRYGESVNQAVMCNDERWETVAPKIRARADRDAFNYPLLDGSQITEQLTCAAWPRRVAREPDFAMLDGLGSFLMIQAEHDIATPLAGARALLRRYPASRLVVATGTGRHGLLGHSATPCIERAAVAYLLEGRLPEGTARETSCAYVEAPPVDASAESWSVEGERAVR